MRQAICCVKIDRMATIPEILQTALQHHRAGERTAAEALYRQILVTVPEHADARHLLGACLAQSEQFAEATVHLRHAVALCPDDAVFHCSLGNALQSQGELNSAIDAYQRAVQLQPSYPEAHNNLGNAWQRLGQFDEAIRSYQRALHDRSDYREARHNLASSLAYQGRYDEAAVAYRQLLEVDPDHPVARYMLSAINGENVPERSSDEYLRTTFDDFAATFEQRLQALQYRGPQLLAGMAAQLCGPPIGALNVLDAGCGTGLCGPLFRPFARRLVGLDLSPGMLDKARDRCLYDELILTELTAFLNDSPQSWDLVIAADTLIYFGTLQPLFQTVARSLKSGGHFLFTVESDSTDRQDYRLQPPGRYCHSLRYVVATLAESGFTQIASTPAVLRLERGAPVQGLVVSAMYSAMSGL